MPDPSHAESLSSRPRHRSALRRLPRLCLLATALAGCASYEARPVHPQAILDSLREPEWPVPEAEGEEALAGSVFDPTDGLSADEAAALAVMLNPGFRAQRAEAGIALAQLVEAGLWKDPAFGWDAMDWLVEASRDNALSGLGFRLPLPRPDEIPAREARAQGRVEEVRWKILERAWRLEREVQLAFLDVLGAEARRDLNTRLQGTAARTSAFFADALAAGAATALQVNLARLELAEVQRAGKSLDFELQEARLRLNRLLGLPPETQWKLQAPARPFAVQERIPDPAALTKKALDQRPDLQELLALHAQAEADLRLAVARQWPELAVGSGFDLILPLLTRFNQPAIETARLKRERIAREVKAAIHELRGEVYEAVKRFEAAQEQTTFFEEVVDQRVEETLQLTEESLQQGQATLLEILRAQRQALDARQGYLESRIQRARTALVLSWISGSKTRPEELR